MGDADRAAAAGHKLYCYVDESGQHTRGAIFVVAAVILVGDRAAPGAAIAAAEGASGKGKVKWAKADHERRRRFVELIAREGALRHALYVKVFREAGRQYQTLTALAIAEALNRHARHRGLAEYKATVVIDGLTRAEERAVGGELRRLGARIRKVRGDRDENEAAIRLADALAGLLRAAEGGDEGARRLQGQLAAAGLLVTL